MAPLAASPVAGTSRRPAVRTAAIACLAVALLSACGAAATPRAASDTRTAAVDPAAVLPTPIPAPAATTLPLNLPRLGLHVIRTAPVVVTATAVGRPATTRIRAMPTPAGTVVVLTVVRVDTVVKGAIRRESLLTVSQIVRQSGGVIMGGVRTPVTGFATLPLTLGHDYELWLQPDEIDGHRTAATSYQVQFATALTPAPAQ